MASLTTINVPLHLGQAELPPWKASRRPTRLVIACVVTSVLPFVFFDFGFEDRYLFVERPPRRGVALPAHPYPYVVGVSTRLYYFLLQPPYLGVQSPDLQLCLRGFHSLYFLLQP